MNEACEARPDQPSRATDVFRSGLTRGVLTIGIFVAVLLVCGEVVRRRLPFPPVPAVQPKVEWLRAHGDAYDTFFIGSSRTYRHIIPELFDELMAAGGQPTRSFNLGFDGMRPPEDSFVLETVLAPRTQPLKYVLVEGNALRVNLDADSRGTMRASYWHDLRRCGVIARATLGMTSADETTWFGVWSDRFSSIGTFLEHLPPALARATNLGRGLEWLPDALLAEPPETLSSANLGARFDGYHEGDKLREMRPGDLKKLRKGVADRLKKPAQPYFSDAESQRVLREKGRVTAAHGGRMIFFHPPLTQPEIYYPDPRFNPVLPIIDLSDPGKFPILFDPQFRKDDAHLNPAGAKIFTRLLVERLLARAAR